MKTRGIPQCGIAHVRPERALLLHHSDQQSARLLHEKGETMEVVALPLTAAEAEVLHNLVSKAISDIESDIETGGLIPLEGRNASEEKALLEKLKERLYALIYTHQSN